MMVDSKDAVINIASETLETLLSSTKNNTGECKAKTIKAVVSILHEVTSKLDDETEVNDSIYTYLVQAIF